MRAATVPSVAATAVAQLAEGGAVVAAGVVVDAAAAVGLVGEPDDGELAASDALAALCVAAADEPQPTSATARRCEEEPAGAPAPGCLLSDPAGEPHPSQVRPVG